MSHHVRNARRARTPVLVATLSVCVLLLPASMVAQRPAVPELTPSGPVIKSAGQTVQIEDPTFAVPAGHDFKAVFEINRADSVVVNEQLNTMARFLNLHARHGIAPERVQTAAVVHGSGWMSLLSDSAYGARFAGKKNPSRTLVEELLASGAQLVLCGQTAGFRGVRREELLPGVTLAISAMTALNVFQSQGFQLNPW